jgi:uracil-DNA glycosylase
MQKLSWADLLKEEKQKEYFKNIVSFLNSERRSGNVIFPKKENIFNAFTLTPFEDIKVVILGQDPYHGEGQAHGLSFSVPVGTRLPPSLKNIYKEISTDLGLEFGNNGCLESWARQGVFLLNSVLTVESGKPASHAKIGWETFTDEVIRKISEHKNGVIFLLWGNFARSKKSLIDTKKHTVLESPHPSPFSAYSGFFGSKHFSKANEKLKMQGLNTINWEIQD